MLPNGLVRKLSMKVYKNIDEYIESFPDDVQDDLVRFRETLRRVVPQGEEAMRYGMPTIRFSGRNLVHFAAFRKHIGFYPAPSGVKAFAKELTPYVTSKGAIQFPLGEKLPWGLITKIVRFRVREEQTQ